MTQVLSEKPTLRRPVQVPCRHCGTPVRDERPHEPGFCCTGCSYVFRLIHEGQLDAYYKIKDAVTPPVDASAFIARDYAWLEDLQRAAEARAERASGSPRLTLDLQGVSCAGCVWLIEKVFGKEPGAREIVVNPQLGSLQLTWTAGTFAAPRFAEALQRLGYLVGPPDPSRVASEAGALVRRIGLCAAFAMNVMLFTLPAYFGMEKTFAYAKLFALLSMVFATMSFLVGGTYFVGRAWRAVAHRTLHIDLPIAIGILGAYAGSVTGWMLGLDRFVYFDFVATFILLMLVGRWGQVVAVERNRRMLVSQQPRPLTVRLAAGGECGVDALARGSDILVGANRVLLVASRLVDALGEFSLASINGEAHPRVYLAGQVVPAGAMNVSRNAARMTTTEGWDESLLARILEAEVRPGWRHRRMEQIIRFYLVGILLVAVGAGLGWWLSSRDVAKTWGVVTAVLVVSCPCAIGLAFPLADEMATTAMRKRGVYVREGDLWSKLSKVRRIVFDKTGTLTMETPVLANPEAMRSLSVAARSALHALCRDSEHPVALCLFQSLLASGSAEPLPGTVRETVGEGVELDGWSLGRMGWKTPALEGRASPATILAYEGRIIARFVTQDSLRPDVAGELASLRKMGYSLHIVSGDTAPKVRAAAAQLGFTETEAHGDLRPEGKASWIRRHGGDVSLILGDGANDSLAFEQALCRGTPVIHRGVLEQKSDFFYLGQGIGGIRSLIQVDSVRRRAQARILFFSILYNCLAVGLAAAGRMSPILAAILMPLSSVITLVIVTHAMRPVFGRIGLVEPSL